MNYRANNILTLAGFFKAVPKVEMKPPHAHKASLLFTHPLPFCNFKQNDDRLSNKFNGIYHLIIVNEAVKLGAKLNVE